MGLKGSFCKGEEVGEPGIPFQGEGWGVLCRRCPNYKWPPVDGRKVHRWAIRSQSCGSNNALPVSTITVNHFYILPF